MAKRKDTMNSDQESARVATTGEGDEYDTEAQEVASDPNLSIGAPRGENVDQSDQPGSSPTPGGPGFPSVPDPRETGAGGVE